ncbi:hypothetical protein [Thalassotalea profundi]|uniref:Uncharacterized protein n=1 Tax=Thalassotalea profundi TaxID=2036687 RepID=A0ABQ3IPP7_9GAMM|nr:hypothetical protein [Thalassotalea profundi]GHE87404.1 hypothetical protein GCM10011501_16070 [Thalassotalea profundi]
MKMQKTYSAKDIWAVAWRLQRKNKAGDDEFPFALLKIKNLMTTKGQGGVFFKMMLKAKWAFIYRERYKHKKERALSTKQRLLMLKVTGKW